MHQNAGAKKNLPSFPHSIALRVGDPQPIDGMRGTLWAQVSVPQIELIHGVDDRFFLEVGIRARYRPDPGTTPLPEFIHGTVRAQYRLEEVDPNCLGWGRNASEYLWIRVVERSVEFSGTAVDDDLTVVAVTNAAVADARITKLLAILLKTRFEATPHRVSSRFRRGSMRSLNVGVNRSLVAIPLSLGSGAPSGQLDSIDQDLLEGKDFGVGISREYILSKIQPILDEVKASFSYDFSFRFKFNVDLGVFDADVVTINISWHVSLTSATASWSGGVIPVLGISAGVITVSIAGHALTQKSEYNVSFTATQAIAVTFDSATEGLSASLLGSPVVTVSAYEAIAKPKIEAIVKSEVQKAIAQLVSQLNPGSKKDELIYQLQTIDDAADAHFDGAVFSPDGVILRGRINLTPRRIPVNTFAESSEGDAMTAFSSWFPGGRIDKFEWSWSWFNKAGDKGKSTLEDRFLLRRPLGSGMGKFGAVFGLRRPLPGLDGMGTMCLTIRGMQVDQSSGFQVPVSNGRKCHRYGFDFGIGLNVGNRLFIREYEFAPRNPEGPMQEAALVEVTGARTSSYGSNTLLLYVGERLDPETTHTLHEGLVESQRRDAGMIVLILYRDGALARADRELLTQLSELAKELEAPLVFNEDVRGSWSQTFQFTRSGEPEWRLISPTGGITWMHQGNLDRRGLARALDTYLFPSRPPGIADFKAGLNPGTRLRPGVLDPRLPNELVESPCPPVPIGRLGKVESVITFVQKDSVASEGHLRRLGDQANAAREGGFFAVVVDGVTRGDDSIGESHEDFLAIPDPNGVVARRFGVCVWPTTVTVNEFGIVTGYEMGNQSASRREEDR
jgi:hypothetical protein